MLNQKLYYTTKGNEKKSEKNSLVFFHGLWGGGNYFRNIQLVSDTYTQYFPDELGFGKSPKPIINYTPQLHCEFIKNTISNKTQITLIGHSLGGTLALNFANLYPDLVKKLILISPLIYTEKKDAKKYLSTNFITKLTIENPNAARIICKSLCSTGILGKISPFFVSENRRGYIGGCIEHTWQSYYSTFTNCLLDNPLVDTTKELAKKISISIIYGDSDSYLNYTVFKDLPVNKIIIPHSDHYVLFEKFDICKKLIVQELNNQ